VTLFLRTKTFKKSEIYHELMVNLDLMDVYNRLYSQYGEFVWWPADSPFEVMVGAILIQQTNWKNVEISIKNLKDKGLLEIDAMVKASYSDIENCTRSSGFFRQKSKRLKNMANHLLKGYSGDLDKFFERDAHVIRNELLSLDGIGPETADSILLFAGAKPKFVVDAYALRIFNRLGLELDGDYENAQRIFENELPKDVGLLKNYHAYLVELGKDHCKNNPKCEHCPLSDICQFYLERDV
jgi:endonuclease-3 related protein